MVKSAHKLVIRNIGLILSGALEKPILDGDTLVSLDGKIVGIGYEKNLDTGNPDTLIDAKRRGTQIEEPGTHL